MKGRLVIALLQLGIFLTLLVGYKSEIVPLFGYSGFIYAPDNVKLIAAMGFLLVLSIITPIDQKTPSTLFLHLTLLLILIPMLVLFCSADKPWIFTLESLAAYAVVVTLVLILKPISVDSPTLGHEHLLRLLLAGAALYVVSILLLGGAQFFNVDFSKVYDYRSESQQNLPEIYGYLSSLVGNTVLPFSLVLSLKLKKPAYLGIVLILVIATFGLTAHKSMLFYPFVLIFIYFMLSSQNVVRVLSIAVLILLIASVIDFWIFETNESYLSGWLGSLAMRRSFFVPADINYTYYDFFSRNDWVLWSNSKLTLGLSKYGYSLDAAHLIGSEVFDNEETAVNSGWLGAGYMQAGFTGMLLYATLVAFLFNFINGIARKAQDRKLITAGIVAPVLTLIMSSDLPTTLLTHGLLINIFLVGLLPRQNQSMQAEPVRLRAENP